MAECQTCQRIAALVKREQQLRAVKGEIDLYSHGLACDAIWQALYRLANGHPDVVPTAATKAEKIARKERAAVLREIKRMLPDLVMQAIADMDEPSEEDDPKDPH